MKRIVFVLFALAVVSMAEAQDIIEVATVGELKKVAANVNNGIEDYGGKTIRLVADLDLSGVAWMPIGTTSHPFACTFDGQGHILSNLNVRIDYAASNGVAGLFGKIASTGIVKDFHIAGGTIAIISNSNNLTCHLGSIAGINEGTIMGCSNTATVTGYIWTQACVGGLVGENNTGGKVQNSYNKGDVYAGNSYLLGGVVGNNKGTIQNCFMHCKVNKSSSTTSYPLYGNNIGGTITGCFYANGTVYDALTPQPIILKNDANNERTISSNAGSTNNILLADRTLYTDGDWNTLCLPFDIPAGADGYSPIAGATVMTLDGSSFSEGTLTLHFANASSIEAGKPYIMKWSPAISDNLPNPVFLGANVSSTTTDVPTDYVDFVGCCSPASLTAGDRSCLFLGESNMLYYPNADMTIGACRAYFQLRDDLTAGEPLQAGVRAFVLDFGDGLGLGATGIREITTPSNSSNSSNTSNLYYTLSGRRLSGMPSSPGLYIHNGRKVLIK